jgi:hypothetical protein
MMSITSRKGPKFPLNKRKPEAINQTQIQNTTKKQTNQQNLKMRYTHTRVPLSPIITSLKYG